MRTVGVFAHEQLHPTVLLFHGRLGPLAVRDGVRADSCDGRFRPGDIVVAQVALFTGVPAIAGKAYAAGLRLGFDAANAGGGINGSSPQLVSADNALKPEDTVRQAKETIARESPVALAATIGTTNADALIKAGVLTYSGVPVDWPQLGRDLLASATALAPKYRIDLIAKCPYGRITGNT